MTTKDKAEKLISNYRKEIIKGKYSISGFVIEELAKECALISVEEILHSLSYKVSTNFEEIEYYVEVKQEIEKL